MPLTDAEFALVLIVDAHKHYRSQGFIYLVARLCICTPLDFGKKKKLHM